MSTALLCIGVDRNSMETVVSGAGRSSGGAATLMSEVIWSIEAIA